MFFYQVALNFGNLKGFLLVCRSWTFWYDYVFILSMSMHRCTIWQVVSVFSVWLWCNLCKYVRCKYLLHMAIFCIESFTFHIINLELVLTANPGLSSLVFVGGFHGNPRFWPIRRGRLCKPHYCWHLQIFRPSNCPKIEHLSKNWGTP